MLLPDIGCDQFAAGGLWRGCAGLVGDVAVDESLVDTMKTNLAADGYKFRSMVDTIVLSPQFLNRHVTDQASTPAQQPAGGKLITADFRKEH